MSEPIICNCCEQEIIDPRQIAYPFGHHGEEVQCLGCWTAGQDYSYESLR